MRGFKVLLGATALFTCLALLPSPKADAQVSIGINVGGPPPVCPYGYFEYPPYQCAPVGYYGPGYFYNGIFLGVGPWAHWGYGHGWGGHRFVGAGGGRYVPGRRYYGPGHPAYHGHPGGPAYHGHPGGGHPVPHNDGHPGGGHPGGGHPGGGAPHGDGGHGGGHPGGDHR